MTEIKAFRGFYYDGKVVDIAKVVAPPYDVINDESQETLYANEEHNVVRLVLGKIFEGDNDADNRYTRASAFLNDWINEGVIKRHDEDSIYLYEQEFTLADGTVMNRSGFIALVALEEPGKENIFPHENTLSKPKEDRLRLMRACGGNLCQVFSLFSDSEKKVDELLESGKPEAPVFDFVDENGIKNCLWQITSPHVLKGIKKEMSDKKLFIADGHHRYETAVNYMNEMKEKNPNHTGDEPYNYVMMMFVNTHNEGLAVLPIHRLVHSVNGFEEDGFLEKIKSAFDIVPADCEGWEKELSGNLEEVGKKQLSFAAVFRESGNAYILTLKSHKEIDKYFESSFPEELKNLDVSILHKVILETFLGIDEESLRNQSNVKYIKDWDRAIRLLKNGDYQAAFLMNSTPVEAVKSVAGKGLRMPQKSTFFYPKLFTGLLFNLFRD